MRVEVDGHAAYYGTGSGKPADGAASIVFIHGAGFDHSVWVMPSRYFARHGYRVVALDLPAHGRSEGEPLQSIEAMAVWLRAVMRELHIDNATVVGHSMGSLVAIGFAARFPECVDTLVLLGVSAPMPVTGLLLDAARDNHHAAIDMANVWSHRSMGAGENPGFSNLNSGERLLERSAPGVLHADLAACNGFQPEGLPEVRARVLVIAADEDKMTPAKAGLALAALLPHAQTCVLAGCGHAMMAERPNAVLDALAGFIIGKPSRMRGEVAGVKNG